MKITKKEYGNYVKKQAKNSPVFKNMFHAFWIGGTICTIGQLLGKGIEMFGITGDEKAIAISVSMIFLGALLTGLNLYDSIAKVAGAGTIVPITGFANSIVSPAMEFKSEGIVLGMSAKMFVIAGPVLVFGITSSVIYGFLLFMFQMI